MGVGEGALGHEECFSHFGWEFLISFGQNGFLGEWDAGDQICSSLRPGPTLLGCLFLGESSQLGILKRDVWVGAGVVSPSLADNLLSGVRIKLFTLVASANAKPGQLILPCSA